MSSISSGAPAKSGQYAKTAEVRERLLGAAVELFAESGFHGTTLKAVAERAGLSERGIIHHFPNKETLLLAVLERHERFRTPRIAAATGLEAVSEILRVITQDSATPALVELHTVLAAEATSAEHPAHAHEHDRYRGFRWFVADVFSQLRTAGLLQSSLSADSIAAGILALLDGLQLQWLYDRDDVDVLATVDGFLAGLLTPVAMEDLLALRRG